MSVTFVLPDLHGDHEAARRLLVVAGVPLSPEERRRRTIRTVQLGDLVAAVEKTVEKDREAARRALDWFDVVLVGNHEAPYVGGDTDLFGGFHHDALVSTSLKELRVAGILRPCWVVGRTLLTHAGVAPQWGLEEADEAANAINTAWRHRRDTLPPLFSACGRARGGHDGYSGILWCDWSEPRAQFKQLHGHTPVTEPALTHHPNGSWAMNLDTGIGKRGRVINGVWLDEDGEFRAHRFMDTLDLDSPALTRSTIA